MADECNYVEFSVLSVKQPWASLIVKGIKPIENRSWKSNYRGPLAIHASLTYDTTGADILKEKGVDLSFEDVRGSVLGTVVLEDCIQDSTNEWAEEGCWHWVLSNPIPLKEPYPLKGQLGIFTASILIV